MMSGLLPSKVGGYDNAAEFSATIPTFAHYLRRLGYNTCLSGKMHFAGPDQLHGYEERLTTAICPADFGWPPNWAEPDAKVTFQDMQNVLETGPCARSLQIDYDDETNYRAVQWLYDQAREPERRPFMLTVSFTSPHDPYVALPEFWDMYTDDEIDLGKEVEADLEGAHRVRTCLLEDVVGIEMPSPVEQILEQAMTDELEAILSRIRTVLLMADELCVGTHLGLGPELETAEDVLLHLLCRLFHSGDDLGIASAAAKIAR